MPKKLLTLAYSEWWPPDVKEGGNHSPFLLNLHLQKRGFAMFWSILSWLFAWLSTAISFVGSVAGIAVCIAIWRGWIPFDPDSDRRGKT